MIEFARSNTNFVTRQKFMIPDSTLRFAAFNFYFDLSFVNRVLLKQAGLEGRRLCQNDDNEEEVEKGQGRDQDSASSSDEAETTNYSHRTSRLPFTKEFRSADPLTRDIPEESKRSIVEWGVQVNS